MLTRDDVVQIINSDNTEIIQEWFNEFCIKDDMLKIYHCTPTENKKPCDIYITPILITNEFQQESIKRCTWDSNWIDDIKIRKFIHERITPNRDRYITIDDKFIDCFTEDFTRIHPEIKDNNLDREYYFYKYDRSILKDPIITTNSKEVWISLKFLKHFLSRNKLTLSLEFDVEIEHDKNIILNNTNQIEKSFYKSDNKFCYEIRCDISVADPIRSIIQGKYHIFGFENYEDMNYDYDFNRAEKVDFIIKQDEDGTPHHFSITYGQNPNKQYLQPLWFEREVLQKYLNKPSVYQITDTGVNGGGIFLKADTNNPNCVLVFAGHIYLLSTEELKYWSIYSIPAPKKDNISNTFYRRMVEGEFEDSQSPDFIFQELYKQVNKSFTNKYGDPLWQELNKEEDRFTQLIILTINERQLFKAFIANIVNIIVEHLNKKLLKCFDEEGKVLSSITCFKRFLQDKSLDNDESIIKTFRNLQTLRSELSAHKESSKISKELKKALQWFNISNKDYIQDSINIFNKLNEVLTTLK